MREDGAARRTTLLDAAIDLVGREGMRGLTNRAVDASAGVPAGSTSHHFRTREELASMLTAGADRVDTWPLELITRAGSSDPARDEGLLANYVTGLVLHQLALPAADFDPTGRIAALVATLDWRSS